MNAIDLQLWLLALLNRGRNQIFTGGHAKVLARQVALAINPDKTWGEARIVHGDFCEQSLIVHIELNGNNCFFNLLQEAVWSIICAYKKGDLPLTAGVALDYCIDMKEGDVSRFFNDLYASSHAEVPAVVISFLLDNGKSIDRRFLGWVICESAKYLHGHSAA